MAKKTFESRSSLPVRLGKNHVHIVGKPMPMGGGKRFLRIHPQEINSTSWGCSLKHLSYSFESCIWEKKTKVYKKRFAIKGPYPFSCGANVGKVKENISPVMVLDKTKFLAFYDRTKRFTTRNGRSVVYLRGVQRWCIYAVCLPAHRRQTGQHLVYYCTARLERYHSGGTDSYYPYIRYMVRRKTDRRTDGGALDCADKQQQNSTRIWRSQPKDALLKARRERSLGGVLFHASELYKLHLFGVSVCACIHTPTRAYIRVCVIWLTTMGFIA